MTDREPAARPTPDRAAAALDEIARGGEATSVLPARAPVAERTTVLPRTRVAQTYAAETVVPAPVAPPRPAPPARRSAGPWVVALLVLVAAIAGGAYVLSTREPVLAPLPEISEQLPDELRSDLQRLRDAAEQLDAS